MKFNNNKIVIGSIVKTRLIERGEIVYIDNGGILLNVLKCNNINVGWIYSSVLMDLQYIPEKYKDKEYKFWWVNHKDLL